MQFPLITLEQNVSRSSWRRYTLKLTSVPRPLWFRPIPPRSILPIAPTLFMSTQDPPVVSNPESPLLRLIRSL
jgi:hypothetical protein